jgi:hypothetical protein
MNEPKYINCYSKKIEKGFNDFEIEYVWKFILDYINISIIYIHNLKINKRKILFNQRLINNEIFYGKKYTFLFFEKGHIYKIVHENDNPELFIDNEYFKFLNSFQKKNPPETFSYSSSKPEPVNMIKSINFQNKKQSKIYLNDRRNFKKNLIISSISQSTIRYNNYKHYIRFPIQHEHRDEEEELEDKNFLINIKYFNLKNNIINSK